MAAQAPHRGPKKGKSSELQASRTMQFNGNVRRKPHSPHSDRNRSGPAARNSEKKSRIMARENDCGRRERFWLARTILSRENDPSSGERLWSRERFWSEPGLRRSSSSTIPEAKGVIQDIRWLLRPLLDAGCTRPGGEMGWGRPTRTQHKRPKAMN